MRRNAAIGAAVVVVIAIAIAAAPRHAAETPAPRPAATSQPTLLSPAVVATRFLVTLSLPVMLDARKRAAAIDRYASSGAAAGLRREYAREGARLRRYFRAGPRVTWTALLGHRDRMVGPGVAVVDVWAVAIGGAGSSPVSTGWRLLRVRLALEGAGWKVVRVRERPAPPMDVTAQRFARTTRGFTEYRVAP